MHDLTPAYALDALGEQERREYEGHLRTCAQCQEELAGLRDTAASLAYSTLAVRPPTALRERLLSSLGAQETAQVIPLRRRRPVQVLGAAGAVAAAAAIALAVWAGSLSSSLSDERAAGREQASALEIIADPDASRIALAGVEGTLVVAEDGSAALAFSSLDLAPAGETYEAWVIRDGVAVPAGLFTGGDGASLRLSETVASGVVVAVTIEPAGGVDQPTSEPIFSAIVESTIL